MSWFKNVKKRILSFLIGVIATSLGLIMLYYDFFGKKVNSYSGSSYYSWAAFFIGIACLMISFERKKKNDDRTDSSVNISDDKPRRDTPIP